MACSSPTKEVEGESRTMGPNWLELPRDVTANILQRLDTVDIVTRGSLVCPLWWNICKDPFMWRIIDMSNLRHAPDDLVVKICRCAIKRSCGHLEGIDIEYFGTNDLLKYIADCTSHLKRMGLSNCWQISDNGFLAVANKFPLLEDLDVSFCRLSKDSLEVIGRCCPLLKSLKFSRKCGEDKKWDDEAFAIAKTMPELRHLHIDGSSLTNDGLIAILDGCPLLESLDLRGCLNLDLGGSLGKRCREQMKELHLGDCDSYWDYVDNMLGDFLDDLHSNSGVEFQGYPPINDDSLDGLFSISQQMSDMNLSPSGSSNDHILEENVIL